MSNNLSRRNSGSTVSVLISILFFTFQIDSDLVFDDATASNDHASHADHRKSNSNVRHHSNTSRRFQNTKSHQGPSSSDHQSVAPVESPLEVSEEAKPDLSEDSGSSFFGTLSELGRRAKRDWSLGLLGDDSKRTSSTTEDKGLFGFSSGNIFGGWFSGSDAANKPEATSSTKSGSETESGEALQTPTSHRYQRSTTADNLTDEADVDGLDAADEESTTEQPETVERGHSDLAGAAARRTGQLHQDVSDDEDYFSEAASGSGMDGRTVPPTSAVPPSDRQPSEYSYQYLHKRDVTGSIGRGQDLPKREVREQV